MVQGSIGMWLRCAGCLALMLANLHAAALGAESRCRLLPQAVIQSLDIPVSGTEPVRRVVVVPPGTQLDLIATEQNVDVTLELPDFGNTADNPVRRLGPQRMRVHVARDSRLVVEVRSKERDAIHGRVLLDIARIERAGAVCDAAREGLALGDAHYAQAQLISSGRSTAAAGSLRREYEEAVSKYDGAVRALEPEGPSELLAHAQLSAAAASYQDAQDWNGAASRAERAAATYRLIGNPYGEARAKAMGAAARMEVALAMPAAPRSARSSIAAAMLAGTREDFNELAAFHARRAERFDQALALNNLGIAYYYEGRFDDATRSYGLAQPIYTQLHERQRAAQVLQNVALIDYERGRFRSARDAFTNVSSLLKENDNPKLYADVLNNLALAELGTGALDVALEHYAAALAIFTRIQSPREQARSLHGIGAVYSTMGDGALATEYFERALALRTPALDARGRIATLRVLAIARSDAGRHTDALALREEALSLAVAPTQRARILVQIAMSRAALGQVALALDAVSNAISLAADQDRVATARAQAMRARLFLDKGELANAARDVNAALPVFRAFEAPQDELSALLLNARINEARGAPTSAGAAIDAALEIAERLRLQSANPEMRAGLWRAARPAFDQKIALVLSARAGVAASTHRSALAALEIAEQFRARALADYRGLTVGSTPSQSPEIGARREALYVDLAQRRTQLETRLERAGERAGEADATVIAIRSDIAALQRQIDQLNASLASARAGRAPNQGSAHSRSWTERIPEDAAVVEYWLGERATLAWVLSKDRTEMIELKSTADIDARARRLQQSLSHLSGFSSQERLRRAAELSELVIAPLPAWALSKRSLTFIPDGALYAVPFGALTMRQGIHTQHVVEHHDVAVALSITDLVGAFPEVRATAPRAALVLSDPVYTRDDERLSEQPESKEDSPLAALFSTRGAMGNAHFRRLSGARREAQVIADLLPAGTVDRIEGFAASRQELLKRDLSRYGYIHIAAHAVSDTASPKLSRIVLSTLDQQGRSQVGDVFAGDLALRRLGADLVVFSGCETALGREVAGEGLTGLQYAAHASGAKAVVASLWEVSDRASETLMQEFYALLTKEPHTLRSALAEATRRTRARYSDPVLWSAYQLSISAGTTLH